MRITIYIFLLLISSRFLYAEPRGVYDIFEDENLTDAQKFAELANLPPPNLNIDFQVRSEDGKPLSGAEAQISYYPSYADYYRSFTVDNSYELLNLTTDEAGKASVDVQGIRTLSHRIAFKKEGYYPSVIGKHPTLIDMAPKLEAFLFANPPESFEIALRPIGNPIPLRFWQFVDRQKQAPVGMNREFGFDLMENDWVLPGKYRGKVVDMIVKFQREMIHDDFHAVLCTIRFPQTDDGFIPLPEYTNKHSYLRFPRIAPEKGYEMKTLHTAFIQYPEEIHDYSKSGPENMKAVAASFDILKDKKILFQTDAEIFLKGLLVRFRSQRDPKTGELSSAHYGLFRVPSSTIDSQRENEDQPISLRDDYLNINQIKTPPYFDFSLLVNPTANDRNLEYNHENLVPKEHRGRHNAGLPL